MAAHAPRRLKPGIVERLKEFDRDGNGMLDAAEVADVVADLIDEEVKGAQSRRMLCLLAVVLLILLACNVGLAVGVSWLVRDSLVRDDVMVSKHTGAVVQVASSDFYLDSNGALIARGVIPSTEAEDTRNGTASIDPPKAVTVVPSTDTSGRLLGQDGRAVQATPTTDGDGVLVGHAGTPVRTEQASYGADMNDELIAVMFEMPIEKLQEITQWTLKIGNSSINMHIAGVERETLKLDIEGAAEEEAAGSLADGEEGPAPAQVMWLNMEMIKFASGHYRYSMLLLIKAVQYGVDGVGGEPFIMADAVLGPAPVERGKEHVFDPESVVEGLAQQERRRHLLLCCGGPCLHCYFEDGWNAGKDAVLGQVRSAVRLLDDIRRGIAGAIGSIDMLYAQMANLPNLVVDQLKNLPWLPDPGTLIGFLEERFKRITSECQPICRLATLGRVPGKLAKYFAGHPTVIKRFPAPVRGKLTAQLNEGMACMRVPAIKMDYAKLANFLGGLLLEVIQPVLDAITGPLRDAATALVQPLLTALETIKSSVNQALGWLDETTGWINDLVGRRRRALLSDIELGESYSEAEHAAAFAELISEALGDSHQRALLAVADRGTFGASSGSGASNPLLSTIDSMYATMHSQVQAGFREQAADPAVRRRLLADWGQLAGVVESISFSFGFSYDTTLRASFAERQLRWCGDLLTAAGAKKTAQTKKMFVSLFPGVFFEAAALMSIKMPAEVLFEGGADIELQLAIHDFQVDIDLHVDGRTPLVRLSPGDLSNSGIRLQRAMRGAASAKLWLQSSVTMSLCFFGECLSLDANGDARVELGFDGLVGGCGDSDGDVPCESFSDPASDHHFGTQLTDDVEYSAEDFNSCFNPGGAFTALGLWVHAPTPRVDVSLIVPDGTALEALATLSQGCGSGGTDMTLFSMDNPTPLLSEPIITQCLASNGPQQVAVSAAASTGSSHEIALQLQASPYNCLRGEAGNEGALALAPCNSGDELQRWVHRPDGSLRLATHPQFCVDLAFFDVSDRAKIQMYGCNDHPAQKWALGASSAITLASDARWCVDVINGIFEGGNGVWLIRCDASAPNDAQRWNTRLSQRSGTASVVRTMPIKLRSGAHLCVSPAGGALELRTCGAGDTSHWWSYWSDGTLRPAADASSCVDLAYFDRRDSAPLQLVGCNYGGAQTWHLNEGMGTISLALDPTWCVDAPGGQLGPLQLYRCLYNSNQAFTFPSVLPSSLAALAPIRLRWGASSCLAATSATPDGALSPLSLSACGTAPAQLDKWHTGADGTLRLAVAPTQCLDLYGNDAATGRLVLIGCNGHQAQKWSASASGTLTLTRDPSQCVTAEGSEVALRPCNGSPAQVWAFPVTLPAADTGLALPLLGSPELCLAAAADNLPQVAACGTGGATKAASAAQWIMPTDGSLRPAGSPGQCLTLAVAPADGADLQLEQCDEGGHGKGQGWEWRPDGTLRLRDDPVWCLHAWTLDPGSRVRLLACAMRPEQDWSPTALTAAAAVALPLGGPVTLSPAQAPGSCLDAAANAGGVANRVGLIACQPDLPTQKWAAGPGGGLHPSSGGCLDLLSFARNNGAALAVFGCEDATPNAAQMWALKPGGSLALTMDPSFCLDSQGGTSTLWACNGGWSQRWDSRWARQDSGDTPVRLTSGANAALCLGVLIDPEAPNLSWAPLGAVPCGAPGSAWVLPGNGNLRHEGSGQCVDLFWNSRTEGALLGLHDCSDAPAQTWAVHASGSITLADDSTWCLGLSHHGMAVLVLCERGLPAHTWSLPAIIPSLAPPPAPHAPAAHFFTIHHSVSATLCVSPGGEAPANGSPAVLATCAEGPGAEVDAQTWQMLPDGSLRPKGARNKCLDLPGNTRAERAGLQLWDCNGNAAQRWTLLASGAIALEDDHSWVLDLNDGVAEPGARVQLFGSHAGAGVEAVPAQRWTTVLQLDTAAVSLQPAGVPGRCLAVLDTEPAEGAWLELGLRACGAIPSLQRWVPSPGGGPLAMQLSDTENLAESCVDLNYFNMADGADVRLMGCNGLDSQRWALDARGQLALLVNPAFCLAMRDGLLQLGHCDSADAWVIGAEQ